MSSDLAINLLLFVKDQKKQKLVGLIENGKVVEKTKMRKTYEV